MVPAKKLLWTWVFISCCWLPTTSGNKLFYREFYISDGCLLENNQPIQVHLDTSDANCVLLIRSSPEKQRCFPVRNCTVQIIAPAGYGMIVTPVRVRIQHNVAKVKLQRVSSLGPNHLRPPLYQWPPWEYQAINLNDVKNKSKTLSDQVSTNIGNEDESEESMRVFVSQQKGNHTDSEFIPASASPSSLMMSVFSYYHASSWKSLDLEIIITLFAPVNHLQECSNHWFLNCGNRMCIRQALRCDKMNNCGNGNDEKNCGLKLTEILVLFFFLLLVIIFILIVLYLYVRMERRHRKAIPKIQINSVEEKSESQSI